MSSLLLSAKIIAMFELVRMCVIQLYCRLVANRLEGTLAECELCDTVALHASAR